MDKINIVDKINRKTHWENVYQDKAPLSVSWHQEEPVLSLQLIRHSSVSLDSPIIDVGGGASLLVDCLCDEGYSRVAVLDISSHALRYARERLGDNANKVEWYENDVTSFKAPHPFSVWHDRAVFHFLTEASDRKEYVKNLKRTLEPGGYLIIAAFAQGGPLKCSGLDIVQYDADKLVSEIGNEFELVEELNEVHITPDNKEQKFIYFRLRKKGVNQ